MKIGEIEVVILVNGKAAQEYPDIEHERAKGEPNRINEHVGNKATGYIEAVPDANFAFSIRIQPSYMFPPAIDYLSLKYTVDGGKVRGSTLSKERHAKGECERQREGHIVQIDGKTKVQKFRFSELQLREDQISSTEIMAQEDKYQNLGVLHVEVWRKTGKRDKVKAAVYDYTRPATKDLHQKAVIRTAVSMGTRRDDAVDHPSGKTSHSWRGTYVDKQPIAKFKFLYRDKRGLQQLGIIERTPAPPPEIPIEDRNPDDIPQEKRDEAIRRLQVRLKAQAMQLKKEVHDDDRKRVKPETTEDKDEVMETENPNKKRRIEVIDLSDSE